MTRQSRVLLIPLRFPLVRMGEDLGDIVIESLKNRGLTLKRADVLAVASKIVSICERRIVQLRTVPSSGKRLARKWKMDARMLTVVSSEADKVLGGLDGFLLTVKNGILTANAGVDAKNSPPGTVILWPKRPDGSAEALRKGLEKRFRTKIGVVVVDSRITPLRLGTTGLAIGVSGFEPLKDHTGRLDLYGRKVRVTRSNVADDLAAAAHLLMGERQERIGAVVIRNAAIETAQSRSSRPLRLKPSRCLIFSGLASR